MSIKFNGTRNTFFSILFAALFITMSFTAPSSAQTICAEDEGQYVVLTNGSTANKVKDVVDEWDEEVVKIRLARPGVLTMTGEGPSSLTSLYDDLGNPIDNATLGTNLWDVLVPAGDYCFEVATTEGPSADFELEVAFTDICQVSQDDHSDRAICATPLTIDVEEPGVISVTPIDLDYFTFTLTSTDDVCIDGTGTSVDLNATLYDEAGLVEGDDVNGGAVDLCENGLAAGTYYIRIEGANNFSGAYTLEVTLP